MKRIIVMLMLALSPLLAEVEWFEGGYDAAFKTAAQEQKLVMVMLSREGCDACWYMLNIVFEDENVAAEIGMDFVPVYFDVHQDKLPEGLGYIGTPTFYFFAPDGTRIDRLNGGANVKDFTDVMRDVKKKSR